MVSRAANLLFEDLGCARFVQGGFLGGQRLTDGADASVTLDEHCGPIDSSFARKLRTT